MSDEVTKPFNMVRPFKRPAEDRQTAEQMKREDYDWMVIDRDAWQAVATKATADLDAARAEVLRLTTERDTAEREKQLTWENLQRMIRKCDAVILERDVSRDENYRLREERNKLHKENEGLRADALAYPPTRIDAKQYADLKADHELQATMIETLQEGLKRTEAMLAKVQGRQYIDDSLKGVLLSIARLSAEAQGMVP